MMEILKISDADIVVGSRYVEGGGTGDWNRGRIKMSQFAPLITNSIAGTGIADPMSGYFMMRREVFLAALPRLSSMGFKILLDIFASSPRPLKAVEVPYEFQARQYGESKLDSMVLWEFLLLLLDKLFGRYIPIRFVSFALIGGSGVFVHFAVLTLIFKGFDGSFFVAQTAATLAAITSNFLLNNALTYRDRRLKGFRLLLGWVSFNLVCGVGTFANVGIANWLFTHETIWFISALAGIAVGVVWNYAMSAIFTWRTQW
jgi:dolichol-phosphate mannosyltransferase